VQTDLEDDYYDEEQTPEDYFSSMDPNILQGMIAQLT
jgi:hypothetical protein